MVISVGLIAHAQITMPSPRAGVFFPIYWVLGNAVATAEASDAGVSVENRLVAIYLPDARGNIKTLYGYGYIKEGTLAINPFTVRNIEPGETYKAAIPQGEDYYGSEPVDVTISGLGFDRLSENLVLAYGAGPSAPSEDELAPTIQVWFGHRLYQSAIVEAGEKFIIATKPEIKLEISIQEPFALSSNISDYSIELDPGTTYSQILSLGTDALSATSFAVGTEVRTYTLSYSFEDEDELSDGEHTFEITASSAGTMGIPGTAVTYATVEVAGGPLRIVGVVLTYPVPFIRRSPPPEGVVTIQYAMSQDADIEITIFSVEGRTVAKQYYMSGTDGGSSGTNKVTWNTLTFSGAQAGAAVYVGSIVAKQEGRLLAKFKVAIID